MAAAQATTVLGDADFPAEWGDTVPYEAFIRRLDVVKAELPSRFTKIGKRAFYMCTNLKECLVPPGVEVSENSAFGRR